ncbi:PREDICTED: uncharacterized protein LOC109462126 [Branchiostoma belcheri]|uniref:Uncharacterized protein LOC109462126 n=1 Tax=Branchiostoma belcheri TaxID=7741 RepID=A0A6P4XU74_BRABE|nr:PREDICTED: uncharacterized protein LOC109462126 [Branchiostoma belcheri]
MGHKMRTLLALFACTVLARACIPDCQVTTIENCVPSGLSWFGQLSYRSTQTIISSKDPLSHRSCILCGDISTAGLVWLGENTQVYPSDSTWLAVRGHPFNVLSVQTLGLCNNSGVNYLTLVEGGIIDLEPNSLSVFQYLYSLYLDFNNLTVIKKEYFAELTTPFALTILSLSHNKIADIESGSFAELGRLEFLVLEHNLLRYVRAGWFFGLSNLKELILTSNRLETVQKGAFAHLSKLNYFDMSDNNLVWLPTEYRWLPNNSVAYKLGENELFSVHNQISHALKWQAVLLSDLSFVQVRLGGFGVCSTHAEYPATEYRLWLHHDTPTLNVFPKTDYDYTDYAYICARLLYGSRVIVRSQTFRTPFVVMAVTGGATNTEHRNTVTVLPWCERFWSGGDTASFNLDASGESTVELAALSVRENNKTIRLVSVVFDLSSSVEKGDPVLDSPIRTNSTQNVTCVVVSGETVTQSFLTATEREKSDTNVHPATGEHSLSNTTSINNTGDVREEPWTSNTTDVTGTDDVTSTDDVDSADDVTAAQNYTTSLPTTDIDAIPTPTQKVVFLTTKPPTEQQNIMVIVLTVSLATVLVAMTTIYLVKRWLSGCHGNQDGPGNSGGIPDDAIAPLARAVVSINSWMIPTGLHGNEGDAPPYWEIPDDYFEFSNPGYRYRRPSLDGNPYSQIPDEYYSYENTARQANWRPSSLPLALDVRYENFEQHGDVQRWQWQPSDLDEQDDDVTTFYAAAAEVALPTLRKMSKGHAYYRNVVRSTKRDGYSNRLAELRKNAGSTAYGTRTPKYRPFELLARRAYGTWPSASTVKSRGRNIAVGVAWGEIKPNDQGNTPYGAVGRLVRDRRRSHAYGRPRSVLASGSTGAALQTYQNCGAVLLHKSWSQETMLFKNMRVGSARMDPGRRHSM